MLLHLCNHHLCFSFTSPKTHRNPSTHHCHTNLPFYPCIRRSTAVSAAETSNSALPQSAIQRIAEKLRSLGYVEQDSSSTRRAPEIINTPGEIFVPLPTQLPKYRVGHTLDPSWSTPENPVPQPGSGNVIQNFHALRSEVLDEEKRAKSRNGKREERLPSLAELKLPKEELDRLRTDGIGLRKKLKVGKAGITEGIVNGIHERWRRSEVVKIVCEDICRLNMKRTHELLERKTGGLVVWRSGSNIVLYRGPDYKFPYFLSNDGKQLSDISEESCESDTDKQTIYDTSTSLPSNNLSSHPPLIRGVGSPDIVRFQLPGEAQMVFEADALLEGIGPRFKDWWGYDPLPVDADLLPAVVTGYRRPFRLLPYGVKPKLTNDEMNVIRRLARPLPCHFALGRNRKLQGLAIAILKLWEKCEIAKIAIKRGVQNTNSELMAEELKSLTGGTLLSRDREYIVFYRGKDFLPATVSSAIERRRNIEMVMFENEKRNSSVSAANESKVDTSEQTYKVEDEQENDGDSQHHPEEKKLMLSVNAIERTSSRLSDALAKKSKAEKLLAELEKKQIPQPLVIDKEGITEEERYMLRKVGLRMKAFLLLGRRGVFDGTIENMHLHWKYRELVKVCIGNRSIDEVNEVARILEAESGGILIAVERVSKGYAIIVYRGKNYKRPASLRPRTLLTKREAMKRSLEAQRHKSLKLHVLMLNKNIEDLKLELGKDKDTNSSQLTEEALSGFVAEKNDNIHHEDEKSLSRVPDNDSRHYVLNPEADKTRETQFSDEIVENQEDIMNMTKGLKPRSLQESAKDAPCEASVNSGYLFNPPVELLPEGTRPFVNGKKKAGNNNFSYAHKPLRGQTHPVTDGIPHGAGNLDSVGHKTVESKTSVQEATSDMLSLVPLKALQLSNKERLLLRKQALQMKNRPVLAVGKSNSVSGVAKAIKAHFLKHPLAVVSIKGRAEGTSIREVIYNLEQATGSVLVSQEPSKVILYRGWQSGPKHDRDSSSKDGSISGKINSVSSALISAIRLEMGLETNNKEEHVSSKTTFDGNTDD